MENPAKRRYYLLFIEQDLFCTWCLIRAFGSLVSNRGRRMIQVCTNEQHAWQEMWEVEYIKRQRGYIYAIMPNEDGFYLRPQTVAEIIKLKPKKKNPITTHLTLEMEKINNPNQQELFRLC